MMIGTNDRKILSAILRDKMKEVDQAKTLEAKNRVLEIVSHDIENFDYSIAFRIELYNSNNQIY